MFKALFAVGILIATITVVTIGSPKALAAQAAPAHASPLVKNPTPAT